MNGNYTSVLEIEKLLWATIEHKGISNPEVEDLYRKARSRYEKMIIDPDYQTADQVEYSLWKLHYKHIDEYRKKISTSPSHVQGFKLFLSQVVEFYKNLIEKFKIKRISEADDYVCHRFLVCLGDLSRYMELCKKPPDVQKWGVAATYYLEASMVWPYSGNPQNQLALLATYIGDDFLALYHCIRSLAVKDPFPDATDNIMLLFHKNKSSKLQSDLKRNKLGGGSDYLWPLFVRMISFFLVKPSSSSCFEDLPHTFASTMKELESLLALSDIELNSSLEPYKPFDSSRKGPYRAIQAVTILIFVIHNLTKAPKDEEISTWAWTCTFSFMGRIIQRCSSSSCSLLPAVLVFLEWYVDYAEETYGKDVDKVLNAKSYFFAALGDLLSGFDLKEVKESQTALWEDHELRGFEPVVSQSYDFSSENKSHFEDGKSIRITRILLASTKIAERLKDSSQNPILYHQLTRKFNIEEEEEEEEVILFKPLTRYNSEPIQTSNEETSEEGLRRSSSLFTAHNDYSKSGGPPSLSGWVVNRESEKQELAPISEVVSMTSSLADMSISYVAPIPSAPPMLLEEHGVRPPPVFGLTSSEWLHRYNNNLSLEPNWVIDKWGNRMVYLENHPREKVVFGYQRPIINREPMQQQEMEWQLQTDYSPFRIRGHPYPYMGS